MQKPNSPQRIIFVQMQMSFTSSLPCLSLPEPRALRDRSVICHQTNSNERPGQSLHKEMCVHLSACGMWPIAGRDMTEERRNIRGTKEHEQGYVVRIITTDSDANSSEDERSRVGGSGGQLILQRSRNFGNVMVMGMTGGRSTVKIPPSRAAEWTR